jgi:hypothetical protein
MSGGQRRRNSVGQLLSSAVAASALIAALGGISPVLAAGRFALHDTEGQHTGYAIVHRHVGRVDYYDLRERRTGWSRVTRFSEHYRVDFFIATGAMSGYAIVSRHTGRAELFDLAARVIASGSIDKLGRVEFLDLLGRRLETVVPVQNPRTVQSDTK